MNNLGKQLKERTVLIASDIIGEDGFRRLQKLARVYGSRDLSQRQIDELLPRVDALIVLLWPGFLTRERLQKMKRLRFVQSILVGVNHIPFSHLHSEVIVSSNAGAYSLEVGEHAFGLLLSAAKRIVEAHSLVAGGRREFGEFRGFAEEILVLRGRTLGVVGYGGIGSVVARLGRAFGMKVLAFTRGKRTAKGVPFKRGRKGLEGLLRESDAIILAVPLTKSTSGMIGTRELSMMKRSAILVNISRGDIVDQSALYHHLAKTPSFKYATDVWWFKEGKETLTTEYPFTSLPNFVGTPHISGPTGIASGRPGRTAVENTIRYLRGLRPKKIVKRSEYSVAG